MLRLRILLVFAVWLVACDTSSEQKKPIDPSKYRQPLIKANKDLVEIEEQDIENYVKRHQWQMEKTGSGLQYQIYEHGDGRKVKEGLVVRYAYRVELLTGKTCYASEELGLREFLVGRGGVESGLEEAVLLLRKGDKAKIILPSHLAFGLVGDDDCIPKKAVVIYDLELIEVLDPVKRN